MGPRPSHLSPMPPPVSPATCQRLARWLLPGAPVRPEHCQVWSPCAVLPLKSSFWKPPASHRRSGPFGRTAPPAWGLCARLGSHSLSCRWHSSQHRLRQKERQALCVHVWDEMDSDLSISPEMSSNVCLSVMLRYRNACAWFCNERFRTGYQLAHKNAVICTGPCSSIPHRSTFPISEDLSWIMSCHSFIFPWARLFLWHLAVWVENPAFVLTSPLDLPYLRNPSGGRKCVLVLGFLVVFSPILSTSSCAYSK